MHKTKKTVKDGTLELVDIASVKLWADNPRVNDQAVPRLAELLKAHGQKTPIVVCTKTRIVYKGNTTLKALKLNGAKQVLVLWRTFANRAAAVAYGISDNKSSEWSEWDDDVLRELLESTHVDARSVGFKDHELSKLLVSSDEKDDFVPDVPKKAITRPGDLWLLGDHRLLCGDSTSEKDVRKLMRSENIGMIFTDPPYGVAYAQGKYTGVKVRKRFDAIAGDDKQGAELCSFIAGALTPFYAHCTGAPMYTCAPPMTESLAVLYGCIDAGFHMQSQIIWYKNQFILGRGDYHWRHEILWYGYSGNPHYWCGDRTQDTVWEVHKEAHAKYVHPTQKPVALVERALVNSSKPGTIVADPFGGSGTTLIACEKLGRKCRMMELAPEYCDVVVERWQGYTGRKGRRLTSR